MKSPAAYAVSMWEMFPYVSGECLVQWPLILTEASFGNAAHTPIGHMTLSDS